MYKNSKDTLETRESKVAQNFNSSAIRIESRLGNKSGSSDKSDKAEIGLPYTAYTFTRVDYVLRKALKVLTVSGFVQRRNSRAKARQCVGVQI